MATGASGSTSHGLPYPLGTDRVKDGDDGIKALALAVDDYLYAGAGAPSTAPGLWLPATGVVLCTAASLTAVTGSSVTWARYMKIGRTVFFAGEAATTSTMATQVAISLPNGLAGTPARRYLMAGNMGIYAASGVSSLATFSATMVADLSRIVTTSNANAYLDAPVNASVRWQCMYETTT